MKILTDFQICISVPWNSEIINKNKNQNFLNFLKKYSEIIGDFTFLVNDHKQPPEVFRKKDVTGKYLRQSLFFNKVTYLNPAILLKKRLWHRCFFANFATFLRTPEHLRWLLLNIVLMVIVYIIFCNTRAKQWPEFQLTRVRKRPLPLTEIFSWRFDRYSARITLTISSCLVPLFIAPVENLLFRWITNIHDQTFWWLSNIFMTTYPDGSAKLLMAQQWQHTLNLALYQSSDLDCSLY